MDCESKDTHAAQRVGWGVRAVLGIGCRAGTSAEEIEALANDALAAAGLDWSQIGAIATLDRRAGEPGLVALASQKRVTIVGYPAEALAAVVGLPSPSDTVEKLAGTPSVCEAAAMLASNGGNIILSKRRSAQATVAVAGTSDRPPRRPV